MILLVGALAVANHSLTTGGLVAFVALVLQLVWPIEAMGYILALGQEGATAAQRVYEILDTEPTITSPVHAASRNAGRYPGSARLPGSRAGWCSTTSASAIRARPSPCSGTSAWSCTPGETVALVGGTGSGKTTLLYLIARLADATGGTITLDGTDIRTLPLATLRTLGRVRVRGPDARSRPASGRTWRSASQTRPRRRSGRR